jgi:D-3-phosphoglycerate dehydrogenase / 2-oxoglutarate reductase
MKKVLLLYYDMPDEATTLLYNGAQVIGPLRPTDAWLDALPEADGIVTNVQYKFTPDVLDRVTRARVIGRPGIGVDNIDVAAASARDILVINTPDGPTLPVVENTIGWLIALAHNTFPGDRIARETGWPRRPVLRGMDLADKTIGLVGIGRIGSRVATICAQALGMRVIAYDPYVNPHRSRELGIEWVDSLDALLPLVDVLSLHCPLSAETVGLIGEREPALMKPGAYLINTARGPVVDEYALADALRAGRLAGAAVDVFVTEPLPAGHPFVELDNIILSPHSASFTNEGIYRMTMGCIEQVLMVLRDECPPHLVNPEVWQRRRP